MRSGIPAAAIVLIATGAASAAAAKSTTPAGARSEGEKAQAAQPFEGVVDMTVTSDREPKARPVSVAVKGDQTRWDLPSFTKTGTPRTLITNMTNGQLMLLIPATKTYALLDLNQVPLADKLYAAQRLDTDVSHWTAKYTGKTSTIDSKKCDVWQATSSATGDKITACLAPGVKIDYDVLLPAAAVPAPYRGKLSDGDLPLKLTADDSSGKQLFSETVTKVARKTVPESDFQPPSGYEQVQLPLEAFLDLLPTSKPITTP